MACWVHSRGTGNAVPLRVIQELEQEWMRPDEKDDLGLQMCGPERDFWLGTEAGLLGCYEFRGQCAGGDGSEHKGDMGAGCCIRGHKQSELGLEWRLFGPRPPSEGRERCDAQLKEILRSKSVLTVDEWRQLDVSDLELTDYVNVEGLFFQPAGFPGLKCSIKVGRNVEGATSNPAELAAMAEVLRQADKDRDLLYLCDSEAALTKVQQWIGEGGRRTLTGYPEADILKAVVELLHARVQANSYTAFVKVRAHRGEPLNETADSLAEVGRSAERAQWDERTERFVFSCTTAGQGRRSRTWSAGIRNTIREQAARVCVRHALKASADGWRKEHIDSCRRREEICEEACARAGEGFEMNEDEWNEACMQWRRQAEVGQPASNTWTVDFLTREGESREYMGKWLANGGVAWKARRRLIQSITNSFPCGAVLHRWKKRASSACEICQRLKGQEGGDAEPESVGHIQSAHCLGQVDTARAAHNRCAVQLQHDLNRFKAENSSMEFITLEAEQSFGTLWEKHGFEQVCSFEDFITHVGYHERQRPASQEERDDMIQRLSDLGTDEPKPWQETCSMCGESTREAKDEELITCGLPCHTACWLTHKDAVRPMGMKFWKRVNENIKNIAQKRIDGVAIDRAQKQVFLLEFKRTSDAMEDYRHLTEKRATAQYATITPGFQQAAVQNGWQVTQLNFVAGNRSINQAKWEENMKALKIPQVHWNKIRRRLMTTLLQEHERLFQSYWAHRYGWDTKGPDREDRSCLEQVLGV